MIGLIVAVETQLVRRDIALASVHSASWQFTAKQLKDDGKSAEVLCFGDSLVKFGVIPQVFESQGGRSAFNLAVQMGPAPASYMLFRRVLKAGGRPRAVLVDFNCDILREGPTSTRRLYPWAALLNHAELSELSKVMGDPDFLIRVTLDRVLAIVKNRFEIRTNIRAALNGESISLREGVRGHQRNWTVNAGAEIHDKCSYPTIVFPPNGQTCISDWSCDPANAHYVDRFLKLARQHRISVFLVIPPFAPGIQAHERYRGDEVEYDRFVKRVQERYPELVVLDARYSGYEHDLFVDGVHLDRDGATGFTAALAQCVAQHLANPADFPRWVKLPTYRPFVSPTPIEDITRSILALRAMEGSTRR